MANRGPPCARETGGTKPGQRIDEPALGGLDVAGVVKGQACAVGYFRLIPSSWSGAPLIPSSTQRAPVRRLTSRGEKASSNADLQGQYSSEGHARLPTNESCFAASSTS